MYRGKEIHSLLRKSHGTSHFFMKSVSVVKRLWIIAIPILHTRSNDRSNPLPHGAHIIVDIAGHSGTLVTPKAHPKPHLNPMKTSPPLSTLSNVANPSSKTHLQNLEETRTIGTNSAFSTNPFSPILQNIPAMASLAACQAVVASAATSSKLTLTKNASVSTKSQLFAPLRLRECASRGPRVVCAAGDVSAEGTNYLIAGAVAIALVGTALPILFSRKDLCPVCDGAGFVRAGGSAAALNANAARKDQEQIVCRNCNGLGKINQVDKAGQVAPKAKAKRR